MESDLDDWKTIRDVYERAISNIPPIHVSEYWVIFITSHFETWSHYFITTLEITHKSSIRRRKTTPRETLYKVDHENCKLVVIDLE